LRRKRQSDPKKPGAVAAPRNNKLLTLLGKVPWSKLRPKKPNFKAWFGPALLLLVVGLFVSFGFMIKALAPTKSGKPIPLSEVFRSTREKRVVSAVFKDLDATILLKIYDQTPFVLQTPAPAPSPSAAKKQAAPKPVLVRRVPPPTIQSFWSRYPKSDSETTVIIEELFNSGARFEFDQQISKQRLKFVAQFLMPLLILASVFSLFFMIITGHGGGASEFLGFSKFAAKIQRRKKGKGAITFADVAAIDEGITELQEVVDYLTNPERFAALGARAPKGVLLVGPPGTGKTLLARAVAGEASVPFIQLSGSEFVESLVGVGAARVRDLFRQARGLAPCIVFIDELDAAGRQRGAGMGQGNDEREQTLNQLLVEMDGFSSSLGICIMGATNRPDILDPALLRPGRFDRQVVIDVPDVRGRHEILQVHARGRPMASDCDLMQIAKQTPGFTGADLANILNEAALLAVRRNDPEIMHDDLEEAVDRVVAGPERRSHVLTDEEKLLIAYHEAGHAVAARGAGQETGVLKLSIVARGRQLGHASTYSSVDRLVMLKSDIEGQLTTLLGGAAAEKIMFGELSTGNTGDLENATTLARKLVATYGMTDRVGLQQVLHEGQVFMGRDFAAVQHTGVDTLNSVDAEIRAVLDEAERRAVKICQMNHNVMETIVAELLKNETMTGPQLEPILQRVQLLELPKPLGRLVAKVQENPNDGNGARRRRSSAKRTE
jgi:cell division protease FtsH